MSESETVRELFQVLADALPDGVAWGDPVTPEIAKSIYLAGRAHIAPPSPSVDALVEALKTLLAASERHIFGDECLAERNAAREIIAAHERATTK